MPTQRDQRRFVLTLQPTPDCVDPIKSIRWALKGLLRRHHLRCIDIAAVEAAPKKEKEETQAFSLKKEVGDHPPSEGA